MNKVNSSLIKEALQPPKSPRQARRRQAFGSLVLAVTVSLPALTSRLVDTGQSAVRTTGEVAAAVGRGVSEQAVDIWDKIRKDKLQRDLERLKELPPEEKIAITVNPASETAWKVAERYLDDESSPLPLSDLIYAQLNQNSESPQTVWVPRDMVDRIPDDKPAGR